MPKRLDITPNIKAALIKATDGAVDGSTVAVFETISLNTKPLSKRGLFNKGRVSETTLRQMADYANGGGNIPLHTLHRQSEELPIGKTFMGEVFADSNGQPELRSLFYVPLSNADILDGLENDTIGEVSVGMQTLHINCSECGWDYLSPESTFSNLYNSVCLNDHVVGENGTHVILNGLDRWYEQSLVSLGAANGARIQSRTKSLMGQEKYDKLAASGHNPDITVLYATSPLKKADAMDSKEFITALSASNIELGTSKAELATTTLALTASKAEVATLAASIVAKDAEIVTLKAAVDAAAKSPAAELQVKLTAAEEIAEKGRKTLLAEATRMTVALGLAKPADDITTDQLVIELAANRVKMEATFAPALAVATLSTSAAKPSAFKGA